MGVEIDISYQNLVDLAVRAFDNFGGENGIYIDAVIGAQGVFSGVEAVHGEGAAGDIQVTDAYPVTGDLVFYILVFDFQPFSFVDGFEDVAVGVIHRDSSPRPFLTACPLILPAFSERLHFPGLPFPLKALPISDCRKSCNSIPAD